MTDLPRPSFYESLSEYAKRCRMPETSEGIDAVRHHWHAELTKLHETWKDEARRRLAERMAAELREMQLLEPTVSEVPS